MNRRFQTIAEMATPSNSCAYFGENSEAWIVMSVHRDSDTLARSNWEVCKRILESQYEDCVDIERFSHCLVGWMDHMIVTGFGALRLAAKLDKRISDYPILNEDHFSELEDDELSEMWTNCYDPSDRIYILRNHSYTAQSWSDLREAINGSWYHAANMIHCPSDILY